MKLLAIGCDGIQKNLRIVQYLATFTGNLNMICCGMHFGWFSPTLPQLMDEHSTIPTTNNDGSWIAVLLTVGTAFGSLLTGCLLDRIGRKNIILISSLPFFISWLLVAYGQSVYILMVGRFIAGIASGFLMTSISMYIAEIADPAIRGFLGSATMLCWIFGTLLGDVIGSQFTIKTTALISSSIPIISLVTFCWMPESPYYFIKRGQVDQARRSLVVLKRTNDVADELNRLIQAVEEQSRNSGNFLDLFTVRSNRKALIICLGVRTFQQLTGTCAFTFYAQIIFKEADDFIAPSTSSLIYFTTQVLVCGFSAVIIDKVGRKPLMIASLSGCALALSTLGSYFCIEHFTNIDNTGLSVVPSVSLLTFVIFFNIGMQTVPVVIANEVFATNVKALGASFTGAFFTVAMALISKFFQITKDEMGLHVPFISFAVSCVLGLVFIIVYVPETKGKTLEEIQRDLNGTNYKDDDKKLEEKFSKIDTPRIYCVCRL